MNKKEKELFKNLCSFREKMSDELLLGYATPEVLGHLFFNRMSAVAYGKLYYNGLLGKVNREFRNSLKSAYEQNAVKNESFFVCIQDLNSVLSEHKRKYAMLKGAFLCRYYQSRTYINLQSYLLQNQQDGYKSHLLLELFFLSKVDYQNRRR